jgi:hypothetical protein
MRNLQRALLVLCLLVSAFEGCAPDAPHNNPLDPASPNRKTDGNLSGRVLTLNSLTLGIAGALITIEGTNLAELTATDGSFNFSNAPSGNIIVVISKSSYLSDTIKANLQAGGSFDTVVHLDALPQIDTASVVTSKIDHWYISPVYTDTVTAAVTDPDGLIDIKTVYVQIGPLTFEMGHVAGNIFETVINDTSLPNQDPQWLIGKQFNVVAIDSENGTGKSMGFYVTRIIESEPSPTYPVTQDTTTHFPKLDWNPPVVSFDYTYQLQVVSLANGPLPSKEKISSDTLDYSYPDSLPGGYYYWTVAVVDQFGNSSCSKEASFFVPSK